MSPVLGLFSIIAGSIVLMVPGFLVAYALRFRSRTWGAVVLSFGMVLAVSGWLAAFSMAGLALLLAGVTVFGAGIEGMALAGKRT